jgi:hypothetical protein
MKILNIYGQYSFHTNARIIGNTEGLNALANAIQEAINKGQSSTLEEDNRTNNPLFASDGEGYKIIIECHDDDWAKAGFWNQEGNAPQYLMFVAEGRYETR